MMSKNTVPEKLAQRWLKWEAPLSKWTSCGDDEAWDVFVSMPSPSLYPICHMDFRRHVPASQPAGLFNIASHQMRPLFLYSLGWRPNAYNKPIILRPAAPPCARMTKGASYIWDPPSPSLRPFLCACYCRLPLNGDICWFFPRGTKSNATIYITCVLRPPRTMRALFLFLCVRE